MRKLFFIACALFIFVAGKAETKADIFNTEVPITWLGMDFSQMKFIGSATQYKDAGEITNAALRDKYFPGWNDLFMAEKDKYNVADAVRRTSVTYATEITKAANDKVTNREFFSGKDEDYQLLDEQKVADLVKKYNFQGKTGIGFLFVVEGMSKSANEASAWVTFVDMKTKTVLLTQRETGKTGMAFGFRNYWAKALLSILQHAKSDYKKWKS